MTTLRIYRDKNEWVVFTDNGRRPGGLSVAPAGVPREWPVEKVIEEVQNCNPGCRVVAGQ